MGKFKIILFAILVALVGCTKDSEEPTDLHSYEKVLGCWNVTSYYTSGGYFVPTNDGEYYEFAKDGTYTHGGGYYDTENGTFAFDPNTNKIICKEPRGWDFTIDVSFADSKNATFDITGKTQTQSKIIKVSLQ